MPPPRVVHFVILNLILSLGDVKGAGDATRVSLSETRATRPQGREVASARSPSLVPAMGLARSRYAPPVPE